MTVEESVISRINELLTRAEVLRLGTTFEQVKSDRHRQECSGWLASAQNAISLVSPNPQAPFRIRADAVVGRGAHNQAHQQVGEVMEILRALLVDVDAGLLRSVSDRASAEVFDDFLDHGASYLKDGNKNEAGVISGVVFEDSLRRVCRKHGIAEKDVPLDTLISSLTKEGVMTATKAKRARAAAGVRTKATHAQWDEFDIDDVRATIDFARELISIELDA